MSGIDIDALYDAFCSGLPPDLRGTARALAAALGLVPNADVPWSQVFKNEVTLRAPNLIAEGMPGIGPALVEKAVLAHMLSIIEAFGTDRVADRQVDETPELRRILQSLRTARDDALQTLGGDACRALAAEADRRTHQAILAERSVLVRGDAVDFEMYREISSGKQAVGLPASIALATRAGWTTSQLVTLRSTLMGVWLGLQFQDDVADWEDDLTRGGAWLVVLARGANPEGARSDLASVQATVFGSGVLARVLDLSRAEYAQAGAGAELLGAHRLAQWATDRGHQATTEADGERRSPGFVGRLRKLNAWKAEVLG
jgi:hypothetical protein